VEAHNRALYGEKLQKKAFNSAGEYHVLSMPTVGMLKYSTSKGEQQMLRDLGRPGLSGCRATLQELQEMGIWRSLGKVMNLEAKVEGVVKQTGNELFAKPVIMCVAAPRERRTFGDAANPALRYKIRCVCERLVETDGEGANDESGGRIVREEFCIMRRYNDFVTLHRNLKAQLTENNPKNKTLSALSGGGFMLLLPTLPPKKQLNIGGASKFLEQRGRKLSSYLSLLLNRRHVLCGCSELVGFLSAAEEVGSGGAGAAEDRWGRSERR
jgi:hypothetical protein